MSGKQKQRISVFLLGILLLTAAACGQKPPAEEPAEISQTGGEFVWLPEWTTLDVESSNQEGWLSDYILDGTMLYYVVSGENSYVSSMNIMEDKEPVLIEQREGGITCIYTNPAGDLWCARRVTQEDTGESRWYLETVGEQEGEQPQIEITDLLKEEGTYVQDAVMDETGNHYLLIGSVNGNTFVVLDVQGKCIRKIEDLNRLSALKALEDGGVLLFGYGGNVSVLLPQSQTLKEMEFISNSQGMLSVLPLSGGEYLFTENHYLMQYEAKTKQCGEVVDLNACDVTMNHIKDMSKPTEETIALLLADYTVKNQLDFVILTKTKADDVPVKQTLRLGTAISDPALEAAAAAFNRKSSEYRIEVVNYSENDWIEGMRKMNQEIVSGNGPDLMNLQSMYSYLDAYLAKGLLEDLNPYLEASPELDREDFLPNLLESFTENDCLYTIPIAFQIDTLLGKSSEVGEEPGWTPEEFMEYMKKQPKEARIFRYMSKANMFRYSFGNSADYFVKEENGTAKLDTAELKSMLEFANQYTTAFPEVSYEQVPRLLNEGTIKLYEMNISDIMELQEYRNYFGEPITCIGYPTADRKNGSRFACAGMMLGINSQSEYKDAAWEFISTQLTKPSQMQKIRQGISAFPSRKDVLEVYFEKAMDILYEYDENGEILLDAGGNPVQRPKRTMSEYADDGTLIVNKFYASTPEEVEMMKELMDSITVNTIENYEILYMVLEEAESYFYGQKSLEEAVEVIESRVNLYLSENR